MQPYPPPVYYPVQSGFWQHGQHGMWHSPYGTPANAWGTLSCQSPFAYGSYRANPVRPWQVQTGGFATGQSPYSAGQQQPFDPNAIQGSGWSGAELDRTEEPEDEPREPRDYGPEPFVTDIEEATKRNRNFRTALWTGTHLQLTLMSIPAGEDIGLERHDHVDQFIRIEEGRGLVQMGDAAERLDFRRAVEEDDVILIPAGTWHNVTNTGRSPLKLYSIYAPPQHPRGTVHVTKREAMAAEG